MTTATKSRRPPLLILASLAFAASTALICWRLTSLDGLPDIGEPFDVEAFCRPISDESNAYTLYRQAFAKLGKEPENLQGRWETAGEVERKWLVESREALDIWRRGTERPDALYVNPRELTFFTLLPLAQGQRSFARLAILEGTRLEGGGKYDEALDWYLAVLRASRHTGTRGVAIERLIGIAMHTLASKQITSLVARPEAGASTIRRALEAAVAIDAMTPPNSDLLKCEYLGFDHTIADTPSEELASMVSPTPEDAKSPVNRALLRFRRAVLKEPERSRRVFRLIIANHLAYCDRPASKRPAMATAAPQANLSDKAKALLAQLYIVDETAPESARALPVEELARWQASTIYADDYMPALGAVNKALARERSAQAGLVLSLANALYERDHGKPPETTAELVGPYLKALPEGITPTGEAPEPRSKP